MQRQIEPVLFPVTQYPFPASFADFAQQHQAAYQHLKLHQQFLFTRAAALVAQQQKPQHFVFPNTLITQYPQPLTFDLLAVAQPQNISQISTPPLTPSSSVGSGLCKQLVNLTIMPLDGNEESEMKFYSDSRRKQPSGHKEYRDSRRNSSGSSNRSSSRAMAQTPTTSECSINYSETVSSQDSGRATGGLASSLSPMEDGINGMNGIDESMLNIYEFEIPNTLVGLIIGVKGKTVKELSTRTNVRMMIREHHQPDKVKTYQICQVRGKREEINRCLCMLRNRFPTERFPELNLQPVIPPPVPNNFFDMIQTQPTWLTLPEDVPCEVAIASIIDASHFFLQQPTHPSFASLNLLDMYMFRLYNDNSQIPELPIPRQNGLLCAAPIANSWFRAVVVHYYEETDEVLVRFVDYGGYSQLPRRDLRQIRTDLMALPFQATEVILANVRPVDGTTQWADRAMDEMRMLCTGKVITAKLVGYEVESRIPMVELYIPVHDMDGNSQKVICFDTYLMDKGYARTADPSKMVKVSPSTASIASTVRPSLSSHPSQTLQAV